MEEEEKKSLLVVLQRVQFGKEPFESSRTHIHKAGETRDPAFSRILRSIVTEFSKTDNDLLAFDALHALSMLGEGKDYFLKLAADHGTDKMAAYYAILVLAREPNKETLQALDQIKQQSEDNHIRGAVDLARFVAYQNEKLEKMQAVEAGLDFILENLKDGWNPIHVEEFSPQGNLGPVAVWSQKALYKLSTGHPKEVARRLFEMGRSGDLKGLSADFKAYAVRFIGESSLTELREMEKRGP